MNQNTNDKTANTFFSSATVECKSVLSATVRNSVLTATLWVGQATHVRALYRSGADTVTRPLTTALTAITMYELSMENCREGFSSRLELIEHHSSSSATAAAPTPINTLFLCIRSASSLIT